MLSRVAYNIYWMNRYLERADNVARFIDVNARLILDMGWERKLAMWEPLIRASGDEAQYYKRHEQADEKNVIHFLTFDKKNLNSIYSCVLQARENARTIREVISSEMWESINSLYHLVQKHSRRRKIDDLQAFLTLIRHANHMLTGLNENTMTHGEGWHFARIGKMIERADKTARMLDVKYFSLLPSPDYLNSPYDKVEWGAVLKSVGGFEMYLKQFHHVNYHDVSGFLIFDAHFPRAIAHCIATATRSLNIITQKQEVDVAASHEIQKLLNVLAEATIDSILQQGLHEFIDSLQFNLNEIDESLYHSFFALDVSPMVDTKGRSALEPGTVTSS